MKRHIVVHTGVKQYVCEFCRRSFNQPGHLKSHLRLHTGEKPYQCQHCDKSYNHNVSLKSHVTRYHEGASDSGPSEHTKEKMEPPVTRIKIENENEMCTVDTEDTGTVVTELQEQPMKPIKKVYDRSMGRPIGRPKRNAATGETNSIPAVRGEAITAAEPSEEGHMKRTSSKSIKGEWSDKGPTSELTEEDEPEEHKGMRKSKRKASRRPKNFVTAEKDFNSDSDFDPVDTAKKRRTSRQKSGSTGGRRGRPRKNAVVE
ncbi:hypothetical protein NHX12_030584 [Muraenolepis orangiensis]|uniref:C2H2-type domain-containing protein n=1 Tax=Muraenolepis orangiensis TaxID=630683 RepID=A0A9Q0E8G4_9TELE|nr:hypothetical protein NHX12_030584 [Muraenolepis orangiensis]